MSVRIALKRLVDVEVDPEKSNQHEFNAGQLRKGLGFPAEKVSGRVDFLYFPADGASPVTWTEFYTIYDSRAGKTHRGPEWRLYYSGAGLAETAAAGDLLMLFRPDSTSTDLVAVIVPGGSELESMLAHRLAQLPPEAILEKLTLVDSRPLDREAVQLVLEPLERPDRDARLDYDYSAHPLYRGSLVKERVPGTRVMAETAQAILLETGGSDLSPDDFIDGALNTESGLFFAIEDALGNRALQELRDSGGADFAATLKFAQSYTQSRRSRRGESLQNHFQTLLDQRGVPYRAQCATEPGKLPDFILPGYDQYHDPQFPDARLRMVGCKTIVRERHSQWVTEADRVRVKYGLCVDRDLSDNLIQGYERELRFFMPRRIVDTYADRPAAGLLGTVSDLVEDLESVTRT